jgi:hypothetical protein
MAFTSERIVSVSFYGARKEKSRKEELRSISESQFVWGEKLLQRSNEPTM